jgi:hypothetical protein
MGDNETAVLQFEHSYRLADVARFMDGEPGLLPRRPWRACQNPFPPSPSEL